YFFKMPQNERPNFDRSVGLTPHSKTDHVGIALRKIKGKDLYPRGHVFFSPPNEAFRTLDDAFGVLRTKRFGARAHNGSPCFVEVDDAGNQGASVFIQKKPGPSLLDNADQTIRGSQIYPDDHVSFLSTSLNMELRYLRRFR